MSNSKAWGWWAGPWAGPDEEMYCYGGPFDTREEAIECGRGNDDGEGFFIVEALEMSVKFSAERLIEDQYFDQEDYFDCDYAEPCRVGLKAQIEAADAELQAVLDAWLDKHRATFNPPNMFAGFRHREWIEGWPADRAATDGGEG